MKYILFFFLVMNGTAVLAQESESEAVQKAIETFFNGFHKQDSVIIKQTVSNSIILETIAKDKDGHGYVRREQFKDFLKSIVGIPKTTKFDERILSYNIQVDGTMAHAWTPYEFWLDGKFHHCGVNSFQLFKDNENWKIIYLVDTRRKKGCN